MIGHACGGVRCSRLTEIVQFLFAIVELISDCHQIVSRSLLEQRFDDAYAFPRSNGRFLFDEIVDVSHFLLPHQIQDVQLEGFLLVARFEGNLEGCGDIGEQLFCVDRLALVVPDHWKVLLSLGDALHRFPAFIFACQPWFLIATDHVDFDVVLIDNAVLDLHGKMIRVHVDHLAELATLIGPTNRC